MSESKKPKININQTVKQNIQYYFYICVQQFF